MEVLPCAYHTLAMQMKKLSLTIHKANGLYESRRLRWVVQHRAQGLEG